MAAPVGCSRRSCSRSPTRHARWCLRAQPRRRHLRLRRRVLRGDAGQHPRRRPGVARRIAAEFRHWSAIDVDVLGVRDRSDGHAFAALERKRLLGILGERAAELGVDLRFSTEAPTWTPCAATTTWSSPPTA
ncbi:hypothetical protein [Pseudonocardia sp. ICBG601]|uniref:hypothetical protein n=1 Tax=Pseudonocardia sp. ICBG601 TaxID=2846759 RepID=UPI001CF6C1F9|nr:hypothetical protein [Pseudonocardia sp. ICBG601]